MREDPPVACAKERNKIALKNYVIPHLLSNYLKYLFLNLKKKKKDSLV